MASALALFVAFDTISVKLDNRMEYRFRISYAGGSLVGRLESITVDYLHAEIAYTPASCPVKKRGLVEARAIADQALDARMRRIVSLRARKADAERALLRVSTTLNLGS